MRIIGGIYKGRVIAMPKDIRPTQDKVRKALFDILGGIEGLSFLELFAGSAAVGLEAASRGAVELVLVEQDRRCLAVIRKNIESLKAQNCSLYPKESQDMVKLLARGGRSFDIVFLDPPYYKDLAKKTLQILGAYDIVAPNGFVIIQHFKKDTLPPQAGNLARFKQAHYGDTVLSFYRKQPPRKGSNVPESDISRDL
ncbi:MAG TPA: 16S rRNA (guanine(966)-N(2))-methyltransferase RsmD [Patescibacteria group bacterium]|nr:16S rRNA (guanine(966)-N(2))-methyltransferase RsmD [Patescibacteria group bacterium]